jgi:hypothetical protein
MYKNTDLRYVLSTLAGKKSNQTMRPLATAVTTAASGDDGTRTVAVL